MAKLTEQLIEDVKLDESFLAQYRGKQPKWGFGGLGYIVYLRTYARKKHGGNVLERWDETVQRITEGNFRIEARRLGKLGKLTEIKVADLKTEMERFYHLVFNLVMTPPGRGLWMSGTEYAERVGDAENNCWGVSMRPQPYISGEDPRVSFAPVFTFDQAMKGGGKLPS
jgi:ribonucleoside-triphosphate reductase (thioredoxin)